MTRIFSIFLIHILLKSGVALTQTPSTEQAVLDTLRNSLIELRWSEREVSNVARLTGGKSYLNQRATEKIFKTEAPRAGIIHLATHALIDDQNPMYSRFAFAVDDDSTEDGFLHTYELYNMQLQAELAVLSACNTGVGKLSEGEGIMSLARGFMYAGVPSVVMSLWPVDDKSTATLSGNFYEALKKGLAKDEALRQAKLKFLENADAVKANPFYWAGLVLIGNSQPISSKLPFRWLAWMCLVFGLGLVLLFAAGKKFSSFFRSNQKVNFPRISTTFKNLFRSPRLAKHDKIKRTILFPFSFLLLLCIFPLHFHKPWPETPPNFSPSDMATANEHFAKPKLRFNWRNSITLFIITRKPAGFIEKPKIGQA